MHTFTLVFNWWERLVIALVLMALTCGAAACVVSQRAQTAQQRYMDARQTFTEVRDHPERYTIEDVQAAADELAASMLELGDAMKEDTGAIGGDLIAVGAGSGIGGAALVALAARLVTKAMAQRNAKHAPRTELKPEPASDPVG